MKVERFLQVSVVASQSANDFEERLNSRLDELGESTKDCKIDFNSSGFTAIISYETIKKIFDCVADEFHEEGIYYRCINCPHLERPNDGRVKWCGCRYSMHGTTHLYDEACEVLYKGIKNGSLKAIGEPLERC